MKMKMKKKRYCVTEEDWITFRTICRPQSNTSPWQKYFFFIYSFLFSLTRDCNNWVNGEWLLLLLLLSFVFVHKNRIRHLKTDAFQRYRYIRKLYLDGNAITHISAFAFRGLSRLQELSLQNTPLERIGQFTFSGLHNLTSLYLSNNHIRRIESYAFAGTSTIRLLVLTNNPTIRIDSSAFAGNSIHCWICLALHVQVHPGPSSSNDWITTNKSSTITAVGYTRCRWISQWGSFSGWNYAIEVGFASSSASATCVYTISLRIH